MADTARRKKILVFCRFYLAKDFRNNFESLGQDYDFHYLTDGHSPGTQDTRKIFYAAFAEQKRSDVLTEDDVDQIISRCRYCRNIDRELAERQVHAMAVAAAHFLDAAQPDFVISHMIDDYVTHIFAEIAAKRGIRFAGYCFSYFPGVVQVTQGWNGKPFDVREPARQEVEQILEAISQRVYRQNYLQNTGYSFAQHVKLVAKHYLKYPVFKLRSLFERDPYNLHYRIIPYYADRRRLRDYPRPRDFSGDWIDRIHTARAAHPDRPILYMPLAYSPESTIDYWIADRRAIDYEAFTLKLLAELAKSAIVLVKEHLHMQGIRSPQFHRAIGSISGVISVHPEAFSNDLLERADAVIVGGGSVGIEATIRGKPLLSYAPDVYWFAASRAAAISIDDIHLWSKQARDHIASHVPLTADERFDFIRRCLASTVRPRPGSKSWPLIDLDDLRQLLDRG
ncbi:hypothetical protein [Sphingopyxis granuli]|uniref:hypothetical protein n=1 Tax=Sphingopyxis granuli TaxID=267128 RepID=UPI001BAF001E|nr:hypothetical protein [Sphingopyxis granuli]QUM71326.1 hypothetical protein ICN83_13315 [Sphingopyxis granuli]